MRGTKRSGSARRGSLSHSSYRSTAADVAKIAMIDIDAEMGRRGVKSRMLIQVHDELIFELPAAELDEVREVAQRLMPSLELAVPLELEEKWGPSWGELE